jgi:hypothetical protein
MKFKGIATLMIFIVLLLATNGTSLTIPSDKNKPDVSEEVFDMLQSGVPTTTTTATAVPPISRPSKTVIVGAKAAAVLSEGDIAQIKKKIIPLNDDGYLVGDAIGIYVEVVCKHNLAQMRIKEFVENELNIINTSENCYKLVSADEISGYDGGLNVQYFNDNDLKEGFDADEKGIHEIPIDLKGSNRIFDLKNNSYQYNLTRLLSDRFGVNWAENASASFSENQNILKIYNNKTNIYDNITIYLDKDRKHGILHFETKTCNFFVDCNAYHCPSGELVDMRDECGAIGQYAKENITNLSIYTLKNDFDIVLKNPRANQRYAYWYYVLLNEPGIFDSSTILFSSYNDIRDVPDVENSVKIIVSKPRPTVNVRLNKLHVLRNETFNITYDIKYARHPGYDRIIPVGIPSLHDYYCILNENGDRENNHCSFPLTLGENNEVSKTKTLKYFDVGEYYLPGITIDGEYFPFQDEKIYVESRFERYAQFVTLLMGIVTFIFKDMIKDLIFPSEDMKESGKTKDGYKKALTPIPGEIRRTNKNVINEIVKKIVNFLPVAAPIAIIIIIYWFISDKPLDLWIFSLP